MNKDRTKRAIDAFREAFPHLSDSSNLTNLWCKAVEWADKHNDLVDTLKAYLGMEDAEERSEQ